MVAEKDASARANERKTYPERSIRLCEIALGGQARGARLGMHFARPLGPAKTTAAGAMPGR